MQQTPRAERLHIALYGRRNSGKSTLINSWTGQDIALVSDVPGTTTDPVSKSIELPHLGACVITDTAGYDDEGTLGEQRVARSLRSMEQIHIALLLVAAPVVARGEDLRLERAWLQELKGRRIPTLLILSQSDRIEEPEALLSVLADRLGQPTIPRLVLSAQMGVGIDQLKDMLPRMLPEDFGVQTITRGLAERGDVVVLVMPQDQSAPKGRLILPQVQTTRELLDKGCTIVSCTPETLEHSLASLATPPRLIITDSQAFSSVYQLKPEGSLLTSFSVLFAAYKGDIDLFVEGARAIETLTGESCVLIAEACTHAPDTEDIGRIKIPALLRKRYGQSMTIDIVSGMDYPEDLGRYDLIIHCGACMFNRAHVLRRIARASSQKVPITNYGICLAYLTGILDKISY
ncbi:MAG: [FeFe] hydrogenase H-cluster maturation GTPase HydF [Porphyromonadaceae bacterium]|nr:[FeFe] hydrogenase H-cluster maturation GTPase HydF [Porphyromonadaceae bacterium]